MTPYEKMKHLIDLVEAGVKPVIKWIDCDSPISEFDTYDVGMMCRVMSISEKDFSDPDFVVFRVDTDFSEFEDFNKQIAKPVWYDSKGCPTLKWHETKIYPKDKKDWIYMQIAVNPTSAKTGCSSGDMFDFVQDARLTLYTKYQSEGSKDDYMTWLENQIIKTHSYHSYNQPG